MGILSELLRAFSPSSEAFVFLWILSALGITSFFLALERFISLNRRTDYDAPGLFEKLKTLIEAKQLNEAYQICVAGGSRALPRIFGAGILKATMEPQLIAGAMAEESTHMAAAIEKRLGLLIMISNVATLLGLLGTVYGLIMSFGAVANVSAVEKSAKLAAGISAAMNATLVGLTISVLTIIVYSFLRVRADAAQAETDRYSVAILNHLLPPDHTTKKMNSLVRRTGAEEEVPDTDVTPMLNLMVMLIPFLLSSSEFIKIGSIELKLPESDAAISGEGGGGGGGGAQKEVKLDLGVVITAKGFNVFHYFKTMEQSSVTPAAVADSGSEKSMDIPLKNGQFDFEALNIGLAEVKRQALFAILKNTNPATPPDADLYELYREYSKTAMDESFLKDNAAVKLVAEEKITYQTVVAVMDAARGARISTGEKDAEGKPDSTNVPLFPNVSIAGGIIQ